MDKSFLFDLQDYMFDTEKQTLSFYDRVGEAYKYVASHWSEMEYDDRVGYDSLLYSMGGLLHSLRDVKDSLDRVKKF